MPKNDAGDGRRMALEEFRGPGAPAVLSRRAFLGRGVGAAVLLLGTEMVSGRRHLLDLLPTPADGGGSATFFLYGLPTSDAKLPGAIRSAVADGATLRLASIASELAALPIKSPDGGWLALTSISQDGADAALTVSLLDTTTGTTSLRRTCKLPNVPADASLLVTPAWAVDSTVLCLVLSITVPTWTGLITKVDPLTGAGVDVQTANWRSHHELLYFDGKKGDFIGPLDLDDAPSLASVNAVATDKELFLWTIDEPASFIREKGSDAAPSTRLSVFSLGSGKPGRVMSAPGPWPVNGEPVLPLGTGQVGRLVYGTDLHVYSSTDDSIQGVNFPQLTVAARPSAPTIESRKDGTLFISAPVLGQALIVDPAKEFSIITSVSYPPPLYAGGAPDSKAALSASGDTLYVLGDPQTGGLAAYDTASGKIRDAFASAQQFSGVQLLQDGNILAVAPDAPRLGVFGPDLNSIFSADTDIDVVAIF